MTELKYFLQNIAKQESECHYTRMFGNVELIKLVPILLHYVFDLQSRIFFELQIVYKGNSQKMLEYSS